MNCVITSANIFSGQAAVTSRIFPVQLAGSVRKSTPDRPFVCPILGRPPDSSNSDRGFELRRHAAIATATLVSLRGSTLPQGTWKLQLS